MTCIAPWKLRTQLQTASICLWFGLSQGRGWLEHHILVTPISWSLRAGQTESCRAAARSLDAVSFHDSGRSL